MNQCEIQEAKHLTMPGINTVRPWLQTETDAITKTKDSTSTSSSYYLDPKGMAHCSLVDPR